MRATSLHSALIWACVILCLGAIGYTHKCEEGGEGGGREGRMWKEGRGEMGREGRVRKRGKGRRANERRLE